MSGWITFLKFDSRFLYNPSLLRSELRRKLTCKFRSLQVTSNKKLVLYILKHRACRRRHHYHRRRRSRLYLDTAENSEKCYVGKNASSIKLCTQFVENRMCTAMISRQRNSGIQISVWFQGEMICFEDGMSVPGFLCRNWREKPNEFHFIMRLCTMQCMCWTVWWWCVCDGEHIKH